MRKLVSLFTGLLFYSVIFSQDFSNKGKEFWISYAAHIDGTSSVMGVYITSDVAATGTVAVGTQSVPFSVTANSVTRLFIGSGTTPSNSSVYLSTQDGIQTGAAIHVTSDRPVAVYAHIIKSQRSGATLVLPVNVWGKEYVAPSYQNTGNTASYGEINVMAAEANTVVEITPSKASRNGLHPAGTPFTITLANPGDVYQLQFAVSQDISGTKVRSVASGTSGCKPIGVFSATTWTGLGCPTASGGDNLYQQLFPISAWGKNFLTAPFYSRNVDIIRVFVNDPTTVVTKTEAGISTVLTNLQANSFYEYQTGQPTRITADKPVSVVQYITSQSCYPTTPRPPADPEMVVLNPTEQTINNITVFSAHQNYVPTGQSVVNTCYLNIIIKTSAAGSFKINNNPPTGSFVQIPGTGYSYLQENVTGITLVNPVQTLKADSAFSAIAYGFGDVESYGYNAGTNVKDLFQHIIIKNEFATVDYPTTCKNTPFVFAITLPYLAQSLAWDFHGAFANVTSNAPVPDSSYIIDNRTVYVYKLPTIYNFSTIGTYPVTVTALNPTSDGCSGTNQIDYDVEVVDKPNVSFYYTHTGCISDTARFHDTTNAQGRPIIRWNWQFGDNTTATGKDTVHLYQASGVFPVKLSIVTDVGCLSDTTIPITINAAPTAKFGSSSLQCAGVPVVFTDSSTIVSGSIVRWYWDYGNGLRDTLTTNSPRTVIYSIANTYVVKLVVEGVGGCKSLAFTKTIVVRAKPVIDFTLPVVCLPTGTGQFISTVTSTDTPQPTFMYDWAFGDGGNSTAVNPIHQFTNAGPFNVKLTVASSYGCVADTTKALTSVYPRPQALFTAPAEICLKDTASFVDLSTATNTTVAIWHWDFGDGATDTFRNPKHLYLLSGARTVKLYTQSAVGCSSDTATKTITINNLPTASFTISNPNCIAQSITFTSTSNPGSGAIDSLRWNFGDNSRLDTVRNTVLHTYPTAGTYLATLQVVSSKGCISPIIQQNVIVHVLPTANFGLPQVCLSDPFAEFTDSSTIADGTTAALNYLWNFGDPNASSANPNTSTIKNSRHRYTSTGNYAVTLTVTSGSGCAVSTIKQITINGGTPLAAFNIQNNGNICGADTVIIQNKSTVNFGSITRTEIIWDFTGNATVKEVDNMPTFDKNYRHLYSSITVPSQQFTVQLNAYSGGICVNSVQKTVTLYSNPVAAISLSTNEVCQNKPITFLDNSVNTGLNVTSWNWQFGDASIANSQSITHSYRLASTYTLQLQNQTADGCKSPIVTKQVVISPIPVVDAGPDLAVLEGGETQIKATVSGSNGYKFSWTPGTWLSDTTNLQPITRPLADITYQLTVIGRGNCTATDAVNVTLLKGLVVPNAFSPNGDGINDKWVIDHLESYPGATVNMYDRYGRIVFTSKATGYISWDGTENGKALPIGTYYYIIDPKNGKQAITGSVTILR